MNNMAIKVEGIGKKFVIGYQKERDLRSSLKEKTRKLFGKSTNRHEIFWALRDVSFEIQKGEAVGVIGRNGAGKSTLLKILSRITEPTTGRFEINGRVSSLLEVGTGFHPELTGRENIYLNGTILGMKRNEIKSKFDAIVDFSGVEKFIDTPIKHFSSGMKVRLAFSVAAYLEPEILIIDEVLAVGDAEFQKKCLGKMDEISKSRERVVLFVSHNMSALKSICSKGIYLKDGQVKYIGSMNSAIDEYFSESAGAGRTDVIKNHHLNDGCLLEEFSIVNEKVEVFGSLNYKLVIRNKVKNRISEIALLFYTEYQERIAIIDLRKSELHKISENNEKIVIEGQVTDLSFIEGKYSIGVYIASNLCTGNFLDLIKFNVVGRNSDIAPYPVNVRGFVEVKNQFKIYA